MELVGAAIAPGESGKADFSRLYEANDPREYFRVLCGLNYVIPDLASGIFRCLIDDIAHRLHGPVRVIDVGCSYGINAALVQYPFDIDQLAARYDTPEMHELSSRKVEQLDRLFYTAWPQRSDAIFIGLDTAKPAVAYATAVGLIKAGVTANLEDGPASQADARALRGADLIISTGCVGYVSRRTFQRILACQDRARTPIVASFVLRMFSYDLIAEELASVGLVTEKLHGVTFVQRRFSSRDEYQSTMDRLAERGVDPTGKEAEGLLHAELFVSRPAEAVRRRPLGELVSISRGEDRRFGRRFRVIGKDRFTLTH